MRDERTSINIILTQCHLCLSPIHCPPPFLCWKHESFCVKVTVGSNRKSLELADGGLLKGVVATSVVPVQPHPSRSLSVWLTILDFMRNCLESAVLNQFPFPGPKAPQSESDFWWLSKKCILGKARWWRQSVVFLTEGTELWTTHWHTELSEKQLGFDAALILPFKFLYYQHS